MIHVYDSNKGNVYFRCDECLICEDWERRLEHAMEGGYTPQFEYCVCEKMGSPFYITGYCEDAWELEQYQKKKGQRRTGRAYRRISGKRMDEKRRKESKYTLEMGTWHRNGGNYLRRNHRSNAKGYYKRYSNRKNRREMCEPNGKRGEHKKTFDLWWTLY